MTQSPTQERSQQDQQQNDQQGRQDSGSQGFWSPPQDVYDQVFNQQVGGLAPQMAHEAFQAYHDLAEQTLRTARRISEVQTLSLMRSQIVQDTASAVLDIIRRNPQIVISALRQSPVWSQLQQSLRESGSSR